MFQERIKKHQERILRNLKWKIGYFGANKAQSKLDSRFSRLPLIINEKAGNSSFILKNTENGKKLMA